MASCAQALASLPFDSCTLLSSSTSRCPLLSSSLGFLLPTTAHLTAAQLTHCYLNPSLTEKMKGQTHICKAAEYKFPDPIPEFAVSTQKFKTHVHQRLIKKEFCGDSTDEVVGICTEIFSTFLHTEYGGPGTLLVEPFIDMADTINERGLPGGPQAARIAVKWAQDHVDIDWKEWNGGDKN
ncbi:protein PLASTID REDOX INSENSITIVE 2, chloroplastic isoform X2 [Mercurialis annua]|uniref:protein PLASTID REDOX INSENSITIVE 2, chloroplastic isoform X2 n=1 Tax=Mercurialis annua TaxID=3986 RepID=UPI0024ADD260|nr:protein PLASTID REDOX INSENSITIVE 2, chloroplastic isoform X2 [Mercurialis annua]